MKTFKGYLKEDPPAWQRSASEKIFEFQKIQYMQIPLTSSTMEWIFQVQLPRATVFHVTSGIGFEKLKKLQNRNQLGNKVLLQKYLILVKSSICKFH